jgi:prolipoprotein diacylglyceryltransferase
LGLRYDLQPPLAAWPFPKIELVIVHIGPLAIHSYGLGYIVGILVRQALIGRRSPVVGLNFNDNFPHPCRPYCWG